MTDVLEWSYWALHVMVAVWALGISLVNLWFAVDKLCWREMKDE